MITLSQITAFIMVNCPIVSINSSGVIEFDLLATQAQKDEANIIITNWVNGVYPQSLIDLELLSENWKLVDEYEMNLTVTLPNGHKYAANKNARFNIMQERDSLLGIGANAVETWIEEWGTFETNALELQEVLDQALNLLRVYRNSVFGV